MKVGLYNLEPKYPNYALDKLRVYHEQRGDVVEDYPSPTNNFDRVYCSSIFTWTPKNYVFPSYMICGGTGFNLTTQLPDDVEKQKPHKNYGFVTRGCIRRCRFCVVPQKEGEIRYVESAYNLWDGVSNLVTLLDNNILAEPKAFRDTCEFAQVYGVKLDFNQGLDHRLLKPEHIVSLNSIKHKELKFAFDSLKYKKSVDRALDLLILGGIKRSTWYVLCGFDSSFEADLWRCEYLKTWGQNVFVQRYNKTKDGRLSLLARWANQHHIFQTYTWEQFLRHPKHIKQARRLGLILSCVR